MIGFATRNLKVFFKDKASVFFSLLSVFIVIGLYVLFLGDVFANSFEDMQGVRYLMDSWISAGLLAVASITTTMGAFGIMVDDKAKKIDKDFIASPIKNISIVGGYIMGAIIIGIVMCLVTLLLAEIYIVSNGGQWISLPALIKTLGLIVLSTVVNSCIMLFLVSFIKGTNAFSTASAIISAIIGFITGIYIPIGNLPDAVQWIVKCFPPSHSGALFRQVLMDDPMSISFAGAPESVVTEFKQILGIELEYNGTVVSPLMSIVILLATAAVFFLLSVFSLSRKKNK